jgi:pyruvate carboxylase
MLLCGANAVGHSNYPDDMIKRFVEHSVESGMAIFLEAMKMYTSVTAPWRGW